LRDLLGWWFLVRALVDGVELAALDRVEQYFGSLLDTLEE
jgi:hypothetical protein